MLIIYEVSVWNVPIAVELKIMYTFFFFENEVRTNIIVQTNNNTQQ